jgi:hypothetical protein
MDEKQGSHSLILVKNTVERFLDFGVNSFEEVIVVKI